MLNSAAMREREINRRGQQLIELCFENPNLPLQMLCFTITGWENRVAPALISQLIVSSRRNGIKLELSS